MTTVGLNKQLRYAMIAELAARLEGISPQFGKTVLMKLIYLLQTAYNVPLGYRYSFYTYGPYTPEVLVDLERARFLGGVEVEFEIDDPGRYRITPGSRLDEVRSASVPTLDTYSVELDKLVEQFGDLRAKDLELRTTIVFVWRRMVPTTDSQITDLVSVVKELKPHFHEDDIWTAIDELKSAAVIISS